MSTELKHRFEGVTGSISIDELEIISVSKKKYAEVYLCIKSNMNLPFAKIKLYNTDRFIDAESCFESAKALGKEIERHWQRPDCQPEPTADAIKILKKRYGKTVAEIAIEQEITIEGLKTNTRNLITAWNNPNPKRDYFELKRDMDAAVKDADQALNPKQTERVKVEK